MDDDPNQRIARFYNWSRHLYPLVEPFLRSAKRKLIAAVNEHSPGTLLDIGVGKGTHLSDYRAHHVTGVDVSPGMIGMATPHAQSIGATLKVMDGETLEFADASFNRVVMAFVLSVTAHPDQMLAEAWRVLQPGGLMFVLNHETASNPPALVSLTRRLLHLRSRFMLAEIPGWPESAVVRREACAPGGWFTLVILQK